MTGDRPTTPGWHCHRCRSTSCRQRADSDTDHVGRVEYRPLLLTQPSSVSWLWSHTHWCPSQRPQEVMRVDGSANPTMSKDPAQYLAAARDTRLGSLVGERLVLRSAVARGGESMCNRKTVGLGYGLPNTDRKLSSRRSKYRRDLEQYRDEQTLTSSGRFHL